jgi:4-hydroxy-4-methyl-2-oxoglutarate aldolase
MERGRKARPEGRRGPPNLSELPPATALADVLALNGITAWLTPPLVPFTVPALSVSGPAITVAMGEGAPPGGGALEPLYALLDTDLSGQIIVVGGAEEIDGALWGQILSRAARRAGARAALIGGGVRDREALAAERLPVWGCRELTVGAVGLAHVAGIGGAVSVGGIKVSRGDVVVADGSGVVVMPARLTDELIAQARAYATAETALLDDLARDAPLSQAYRRKREVVAAIKTQILDEPTPEAPKGGLA